MPNILVRNISEKTLKRVKTVAKQHNRSLQQELKHVLESLTSYSHEDTYEKAVAIREKLEKKRISFTDSAELLREDRAR